jgi:hypothetical protein
VLLSRHLILALSWQPNSGPPVSLGCDPNCPCGGLSRAGPSEGIPQRVSPAVSVMAHSDAGSVLGFAVNGTCAIRVNNPEDDPQVGAAIDAQLLYAAPGHWLMHH